MPKVTQEYKDDQRAQILVAARHCFVRNGFHRTSMQDVFTESGRSAGAVYRYFPKKEDMILAVAAQNLDDIADLLRSVLAEEAGERGPGEIMAALLDQVIALHADRQLASMALMVWSEALRNAELADRLRAATAIMTDDLAELISARPRTGRASEVSAESLAKAILALLPGMLFELAMLGSDGVADVPDAVRAALAT